MIHPQLIEYMQAIQPQRNEAYQKLEVRAEHDQVPIIPPETGYFLQLICSLQKPKTILEVGTAIGYSTMWLFDHTSAIIDTIEIDAGRMEEARELFATIDRDQRISLYHGDANEVLPALASERKSYDLIFIDAAKGQYMKYFQVIEQLSKSGTIVLTDNVFFHGMVAGIEQPPKRLKPLVDKIDKYNRMLHLLPGWRTSFYSIGDGIAVSVKE